MAGSKELSRKIVEAKTNEEDPLLTLKAAGDMFNRSPQTVMAWIQQGLLEAVRMPSGKFAVRESTVKAWLGGVYYKKLER